MTNFERIAKNEEELAKYIARIISGNCSDRCPGYPYCNGTRCGIAIEEFLKEETLTIEELKLGDRFKVTNPKNNYTYMRTAEIISASGVEINAVNLDTGYYTWFKKDLKVKRVD